MNLSLIGRDKELLNEDLLNHSNELKKIIMSSSFLVMGGGWNHWTSCYKRNI